jgi:hypothetical protein
MAANDRTGALLADTPDYQLIVGSPEAVSEAWPAAHTTRVERTQTVPELPSERIPLRNVAGTYSGISGGFELDLRVDVDGTRPMNKLSGDFIAVSGSTRIYYGSFIVDSPTITSTGANEVIRGLGRFTFSTVSPLVQVTIPRRTLSQPAAAATVGFFGALNDPSIAFICDYTSPYFRTVTLQTEVVSDVLGPVFSNYETGALPSGGSARTLSVVSAYAEAGIKMAAVASGPVINISEAGSNPIWSDAELLASMQLHFTHFNAAVHWDLWQVVCREHEIGPGLYGIMFDSKGRQGCAVFYLGIGGTTANQLRLQLYTHTHELGHCFNLMHSWQKSLAKPPGVDNPKALSWMNYPWNYPGGADAFWSAFPFQFVDAEVVHRRHAVRNNIIPDANPFTVGADEIDPALMSDPIRDFSGLQFSISATHSSLYLGEPVMLNLQLRSFDKRGRMVHDNLHPRTSGTSVTIACPNGRAVRFDPLVDHLMSAEPQWLVDGEQLTETAYIGYGKSGLYFDQPGTYKMRAIFHAPDGSRVFSNIATLRVRYPATTEDNEVAELMIGEEQGALFALLGSDAKSLAGGNSALDTLMAKHANHPLTDYARLVKGVNAARTFKTLLRAESGQLELQVRDPELTNAQVLLSAATGVKSRVDNLSKAQGLDRLAVAQVGAGDTAAASQTRQSSHQLRTEQR